MHTSRLAFVLLPVLAACSSTHGARPTFEVGTEDVVQVPAQEVALAEENPAQPASSAFAGELEVALFVTVEGELWPERMRRNVLARLPEALAEHAQVRVYPTSRLQTLGRLRDQRDDLSDEWLTQVRRRLGWNPPEVILEVTLRAGPGQARNPATGQPANYPELSIRSRAVRFDGARRGATVTRGHTLVYARVLDRSVAAMHGLVLNELMP